MKRRALILLTVTFLLGLFSSMQTKKITKFLPLGDSYTICTGASEKESWPYQLTKHLNENNILCSLVANPARNGFTTQDLIDNELPLLKQTKPDFVTVLIGVNDWVRQVTNTAFAKNLRYILDEVQSSLTNKTNVILITIPDFGVTPTGKNYSAGRDISKGISEFNDIIKQEGKTRGLIVVDIFTISKTMGSDASLVAADGLHPSATEYSIWEKMIFREALDLLIPRLVMF